MKKYKRGIFLLKYQCILNHTKSIATLASDFHSLSVQCTSGVNTLKCNGLDLNSRLYITSYAQKTFVPFVLLDDPLQLDLYVGHLCLLNTYDLKAFEMWHSEIININNRVR